VHPNVAVARAMRERLLPSVRPRYPGMLSTSMPFFRIFTQRSPEELGAH
jgi:hypothetical protein